ncbi:hypothetical protein ACOW8K_000508 [Vibrio parahaemolyticus]|nr:hypothetical protein [Vibrio parahaemolyticus]
MNKLFFPSIKRRPIYQYYSSRGEFFAASNYQSNYATVADDCKHRCVYCDVTESECGGERFSLDHFRPKDIFINKFNGILVKHPYNLYLSCQKCNVLKSKDWQGCVTTINGYTYKSGKGYIDRFREDINKYIKVSSNGRIYPKDLSSTTMKNPAKYMIERLLLNRPNRVYARQKRIVTKLAHEVEMMLNDSSADIIRNWKEGLIAPEDCMARIEKLHALRTKYVQIKI